MAIPFSSVSVMSLNAHESVCLVDAVYAEISCFFLHLVTLLVLVVVNFLSLDQYVILTQMSEDLF